MITKNFINQCEQAEEIQKHKIIDGDYYYWSVDKQIHIAFTETFPDYIVCHPEQWDYLGGRKVIYLPTQEQLLDMLNIKSGEDFNLLIKKISYFEYYETNYFGCDVTRQEWSGIDNKYKCCENLNEMFLIIFMDLKYNKIWTGDKWVKTND